MPQSSPAHRRDCAIEDGKQTCVARPAGSDQFEIDLSGGVEQDVFVRRLAAQRGEVIDLSPQLVLEVMNDRARRRDCRSQIAAAKAIEGFHFEMLAKGEARIFGQESVMIVGQSVLANSLKLVRFAGR